MSATKPLETGPADAQRRTVLEELEATTRAVLDADQAHVQEAMGSVRWERRGLLQRLTLLDQQGAEATTGLSPEPAI